MTMTPVRLLAGVSLAASVAIAAACSGTASSSMSPTAPTASASSASAGANFSPNPDCGGADQQPCSPPPCDPATDTCSCTEFPDQPHCEQPPEVLSGRFTGGGWVNSGGKITFGLTIHCDIALTNNLEINWGRGNNFHIDKESLTSVVCTRREEPTPPAAGVSRIVASSPGTCNGQPATIDFVLVDRGEPGRNDSVRFTISGGGCSLNMPGELNLDGGNIQAHFDQPHKVK